MTTIRGLNVLCMGGGANIMSKEVDELDGLVQTLRDENNALRANVERLQEEKEKLCDAIRNARAGFSKCEETIGTALFQMGGTLSTIGIISAIYQPVPPIVCEALRAASEVFGDGDDDDKGHTASASPPRRASGCGSDRNSNARSENYDRKGNRLGSDCANSD